MGGNDAADERRFATAARVSEINLSLYRTFLQPFVRSFATSQLAEWMQEMHPLRLQYKMFSDANPFMAAVATMAEQVRKDRRAVAADNPLVSIQEKASEQVVKALDAWRDAAEAMAEKTFLSVYGSPMLQAAVGVDPESNKPLRKAAKNPLHKQLLETRIAELKSKMTAGGLREAVVRAALFIGMARGSVDERVFELIRQIRATRGDARRLTLAEFKALVREQYFMLLIDEAAALAAIPALLPAEAEERRKALATLRQLVSVRGEPTGKVAERMERIAGLFEAERPRIVA
jgi:hypothetical protein